MVMFYPPRWYHLYRFTVIICQYPELKMVVKAWAGYTQNSQKRPRMTSTAIEWTLLCNAANHEADTVQYNTAKPSWYVFGYYGGNTHFYNNSVILGFKV